MKMKYLFLFIGLMFLWVACEDPIDRLENNESETNTTLGGGGSGETQTDTTEGEEENNGEQEPINDSVDFDLFVCLNTITNPTDFYMSADWSLDSKSIVYSCANRDFKVIDVDSWSVVDTFADVNNIIFDAKFNSTKEFIASCGTDSLVKLWSTKGRDCVRTFVGHTGRVNYLDWSPDGRYIASSSWDSTTRIWDAYSGNCIHVLTGHTSEVATPSFSPDGSRLVTCSNDKTLKYGTLILERVFKL